MANKNIYGKASNLEYRFIYSEWFDNTIDRLLQFIDKYFNAEKKGNSLDLLANMDIDNNRFQEKLNSFENINQLLEFIYFHYEIEKTIFSTNNKHIFSDEYYFFIFPSFFTDEQIMEYLMIIRNACFEYGLRIRRINSREFICYWDKVFNDEANDYQKVFGINRQNLNSRTYEEFMRKIMK